jgi:hypothetical protein
MNTRLTRLGIAVACCIGVVACNADPINTENAKTVTAQGTVEQLKDDNMDIARLAAETLAGELNINVNEIEVDTVRAVEWRDTSIGCPQPDQAYGQVITPGHKITLRVGGQFYFVHEANGRAFVCKGQKQTAVAGVTRQLEFEWGRVAMEARRDLASTLGVEQNQIIVASAEGTTWSDASMGCPESGIEYEVRDRQGYVITLRHGSRNYRYHTDLDRIVPCPPIATE